MTDTRDYPLVEVLGAGDMIHHARPAKFFGDRIETRCGMEGRKTGRDGGAWCPECVALARAEADTHDERGGDEIPEPGSNADLMRILFHHGITDPDDNGLRGRSTHFMPGATIKLLDDLIEWRNAAVVPFIAERDAATARAESATVLPERWRALIAERDAAVRRAEEAEVRLTERQPIRAEWSTENAFYDPSDDVISQELAARRVTARPDIHTAVLRRQLYAGPWVPAAEACRSCGETEHVVGDPPLCSNCVVYSGGWSAQRPDASLDGLRGPFTGLIGPLDLAADAASAGRGNFERCSCGCPKVGDGCNCHFCNEPYPTRQPNDGTTEDDRG